LKRAYVPVVPRPELRRELIALAAEEADRHAHRHGHRQERSGRRSARRSFLVAGALAAAAAILAWLGLQLAGSDRGDQRDRGATDVALDGAGERTIDPSRGPGGGREATPEGVAIRGADPDLANPDLRTPVPVEDTADDAGAGSGAGEPGGADGSGAEEAPAALAGRVTGPGGAPVPRFRVILLAQREVPDVVMPVLRAFDAADGAFRWEGLEADRYEVFVEADGLAQHRTGPVDLAAGEALALDVALAPGRRLRGWVVADDTDAPIPGATVVVESETPSQVLPMDLDESPGWLTRLARTGSDGGFELEDLASGRGRLRVDAPGFAPAWVDVDVEPAPANLTAEDAAELQRMPELPQVPQVIVRLGPGGTVAGTVTDAYGHAVAGAVVLATFGDDPSRARLFSYDEARTDARGEYRFAHMASGFYMLIQWPDEASFRGGAPPTLRPAMVRSGATVTVDFRGESAAVRIRGTLRDAAGAPLANHKLTLLPEESNAPDGSDDWVAGTSDAEGRFEFQVERAGRYLLFATFGMGERLTFVHAFDVPPGEAEHAEDARLAGTHAVVTVVQALDHAPVPRASVVVLLLDETGAEEFAGHAMTDDAGRAELRGLPPGRYRAVAETTERDDLGQAVSAPFELRPATPSGAPVEPAGASVELPLGGMLRLAVRDAAGAPVAGARVTATRAEGATVHPLIEPVTDADGRLGLPGLAPGRYTIRVVAPGLAPATTDVEVRAVLGADLQIRLEPRD
jgi:hypothetical protein